ncbi:HAD family hydrolase [Millisia brevis]|uniref:HAD family hydrolase n=1 Tax=Millisia brevis TaxID=264148 RepID=UPI00082E676C|nr:HAD family hydrolase [Millisia brevis]
MTASSTPSAPFELPDTTELVVLDMAGTVVRDDGLVEVAFARAAEGTGIAGRLPEGEAQQYVRDTMGMSKIEVFTELADGDVDLAERANLEFEKAYAELVGEGLVRPITGARDTLIALREAGLAVAFTTGFAPVTRDAIIDALGWRDLVDAALSPADVGRGRPAPDLILTALMRTGTTAVDAVTVVGDTTSDVLAGHRAGAGLVVGVLSGAHDRAALESAGADLIVDDVTRLLPPGR